MELSKLMCGNSRISTPTNGSTSKKRHDVIEREKKKTRKTQKPMVDYIRKG